MTLNSASLKPSKYDKTEVKVKYIIVPIYYNIPLLLLRRREKSGFESGVKRESSHSKSGGDEIEQPTNVARHTNLLRWRLG